MLLRKFYLFFKSVSNIIGVSALLLYILRGISPYALWRLGFLFCNYGKTVCSKCLFFLYEDEIKK